MKSLIFHPRISKDKKQKQKQKNRAKNKIHLGVNLYTTDNSQ